MRFRLKQIAVIADSEQMLFQFHVHKRDRDFFWFKDHDPYQDLVEYRMRVHVFGNSPSPAIATYGLRKSVAECDESNQDVKTFVERDFYVDDGLASFSNANEAIDCIKRTQEALWKGGNLRLHKIASNSKEVLQAFSKTELAKDLNDIKIGEDELPCQRSLGLLWNLDNDCFTYDLSMNVKPVTRRGVLSTLNSLYCPLGFIAPITITGNMLMRDLMKKNKCLGKQLAGPFVSAWQK